MYVLYYYKIFWDERYPNPSDLCFTDKKILMYLNDENEAIKKRNHINESFKEINEDCGCNCELYKCEFIKVNTDSSQESYNAFLQEIANGKDKSVITEIMNMNIIDDNTIEKAIVLLIIEKAIDIIKFILDFKKNTNPLNINKNLVNLVAQGKFQQCKIFLDEIFQCNFEKMFCDKKIECSNILNEFIDKKDFVSFENVLGSFLDYDFAYHVFNEDLTGDCLINIKNFYEINKFSKDICKELYCYLCDYVYLKKDKHEELKVFMEKLET